MNTAKCQMVPTWSSIWTANQKRGGKSRDNLGPGLVPYQWESCLGGRIILALNRRTCTATDAADAPEASQRERSRSQDGVKKNI